MGGKKKKGPTLQSKQESKYKIPKQFNCPLCDTKASLMIKMDKKEGRAKIWCRSCGEPKPAFECDFCKLHKPVDVYYKYFEDVWQRDQGALAKARAGAEVRSKLDAIRGGPRATEGGSPMSLQAPEGLLESTIKARAAADVESDDEVAGLLGADELFAADDDE
jgi:transcription elongation factor Elf1